jgi:hypothetical protein
VSALTDINQQPFLQQENCRISGQKPERRRVVMLFRTFSVFDRLL